MLRVLAMAARLAGVSAVLFLWIFALDVFDADGPRAEQALAFLIHSIPAFMLVGVLAIAWRFERLGGALFLVAAAAPFLLLSNAPWINAVLAAPLALTGLLFLAAGMVRRRQDCVSGAPSPGRG